MGYPISGGRGYLTGFGAIVPGGGGGGSIRSVATDPRDGGLAGTVGDMVEFVSGSGSTWLVKTTTSNYGWRTVRESGSFLRPNSAARFASLTGLTPSSIYIPEGSGNVMDLVGTAHLARSNPGPLECTVDGMGGQFALSAGTNVHVAGNIPTTNSFIFGGIVAIHQSVAVLGLIGFTEAATSKGAVLYWNGGLNYLFKDNAATSVTASLGASPDAVATQVPYLFQLQLDRTNNLAYVRMSRAGALITGNSINIAGLVGTMTGGTQYSGFGAIDSNLSYGASYFYGYYITGAQCEGSNKLDDIALGLGAE